MKYAIVYSSRTGNTKLLAETVQKALPPEDCIWFGEPAEAALEAERIFVGFWTDKGTCDSQTAEFLQKVTGQQVYLFGTAGFGDQQGYYEKILGRAAENLGKDAKLAGAFLCQGKMPMAVRQRYEQMLKSPTKIPNIPQMIENFDRALSHPDARDLENLTIALRSLG